MAYFIWQKFNTIAERDYAYVHNYQFFHQLWCLQKHHQTNINELIRFQVVPELKFFGTDMIELKQYETGNNVKYLCKLNFMGLIGTYGILPVYFKELMLVKEHMHFMQVLYDLLQQSSIQLAYEAWSKRQWYTQIFNNQGILPFLNSLTMGKVSQEMDEYYVQTLQFFCAFFLAKHRPVTALAKLITELLQVQIDIFSMRGGWITLPLKDRSYLAAQGNKEQHEQLRLGVNAVLGKKLWCPQQGLEIKVHIKAIEKLIKLLPGGELYAVLRRLIILFAGKQHQWFLTLELMPKLLQPSRLNHRLWGRLGQLSILGQYQKKKFIINLGVIKDESN